MRRMRRQTSTTIVLALSLGVGACSSDTPATPCVEGQSIACVAPGGCSGGQVCTAAGTWSACVCASDGGTDGGDAGAVPGVPTGLAASPVGVVVTVTTLAGSGSNAFANGTGAASSFNHPYGVTLDGASNVYVGDLFNFRIRKISPASVVTSLAGSVVGFADGNGAAASFNWPMGVAIDPSGTVYVADNLNQRVRKVTAQGAVTTFAGTGAAGSLDGAVSVATFSGPHGVALDANGVVYVTDTNNHRIRKIAAGQVSTLAGLSAGFADGTGPAARFNGPDGIAVDAAGTVYVADRSNHRIRVVTPAGVVTTLAGSGAQSSVDGVGVAASFQFPTGIAVDAGGNVYVGDASGNRIRMVTTTGVVTTLAGSGAAAFADGVGTAASFDGPAGVAVDAERNVYVADESNHRVRKLILHGIGELAVTWGAPASGGAPVTGYVAVAQAPNRAAQSCSTAGALGCTIAGLTSGVAYSVTVTAFNGVGASGPSSTASATPN